jgi:hypothetical protein
LSSSSVRDKSLVALLAVSLAWGCTDQEADAPLLFSMYPNQGLFGKATSVRILGQKFYPFVRANFDDKRKTLISTTFHARLGTTALLEVKLVEPARLEAVVPAQLPVGEYALAVLDPRGKEATLAAAFTVVPPDQPDLGPNRDQGSPDAPLDAGPADLDGATESTLDLPGLDLSVPDLLPPDLLAPDTKTPPLVTTLAGTGVWGLNNGPTNLAQFANPTGVAIYGATVYVADYDNHRIRAITAGQVSTLAGEGGQGYQDGSGSSSKLNYPTALAVSGDGTIYVADTANDRIRRIATDGTVSTFAGSGTKGAQDGTLLSAQFNLPRGILVDGEEIYVADTGNDRIRLLAGGMVSTFAGNPDPSADNKGYQDGATATARFDGPVGLAKSGANIYVADSGNNRLRQIVNGLVSTYAGNPDPGTDNKGATDGPLDSATFWNPINVVIKGSALIVSDQSNHRLRIIQGNMVTTLCGAGYGYQDGWLGAARFYYPHGLAIGTAGEVYVADQSNQRLRLITF